MVRKDIIEKILKKQDYKCANKPGTNLYGIGDYLCDRWTNDMGLFNRSGYHIDHIVEKSIGGDDPLNNLQALCPNCHNVKNITFSQDKQISCVSPNVPIENIDDKNDDSLNYKIITYANRYYFVFENTHVSVIFDSDNKIWFSAKEILKTLGYKDHIDYIKSLDRKYFSQNKYIKYANPFGHPDKLYVTQSGLYRIIVKSQFPNAIKFTNWIFDNVLPNIHKFEIHNE